MSLESSLGIMSSNALCSFGVSINHPVHLFNYCISFDLQPLNPFGDAPEWSWDVPEDFVEEMTARWRTLSPTGEPLNGAQLKQPLMDSGAQPIQLKHIWTLCDLERSGKLDRDEFVLAMWLGAEASRGVPPPNALPATLIPPSKRGASSLFVDRR